MIAPMKKVIAPMRVTGIVSIFIRI